MRNMIFHSFYMEVSDAMDYRIPDLLCEGEMMTYYKVLGIGGTAHYGGTGEWHLPQGKRPGKWMPRIDNPQPCERGYHVCRRGQLVDWLGPEIYEVEVRGARINEHDKTVAEQARLIRRLDNWTKRTARLFACDCAERAVSRIGNPDPRSVEAISVARRYAAGQATHKDLAAAWDAAWDAAGDAAGDAARGAAWAAARAAARAATRDAARAAAWAAASIGARANEGRWQTRRLFEYLDGKRG